MASSKVPLCPGPDRAAECDNLACRHSGCQGRPNWPSVGSAEPAHHDHGAAEAARHGLARSPHWPHVRAEQLRRQPVCQATGLTEAAGAALEAHHVFPFHFCALVARPDLELDLRNLITLARHPVDVHLLLGHLDDFRSSNLDVVADAGAWYSRSPFCRAKDGAHVDDGPWERFGEAIKADSAWQAKHAARMKPWDEWSDGDKTAFRALLDRTFPPAVVILPHAA